MTQLQHSIVGNGDEQFVTIFVPGADKPLVAGNDHPNWSKIIEALTDPEAVQARHDFYWDSEYDDYVTDLFDVAQAVAKKFDRLSDRVSVANGTIYLDGEEIHNALSDQILRFLDQGVDDWQPLVAFFEKLLSNPQEHSREQLYEWLVRHDVTISPEGDIVFYKGVEPDGNGGWRSIASGVEDVLVDGEVHVGKIPNNVGSIIEMPRGDVHHDPRQGCSVGLHVANWRYAHDWANGAVLEVHVNPRDVVSVPTESNYEKVRCCRYKVVQVLDAPYSGAVLPVDATRDDDDQYVDTSDLEFETDTEDDPGCPYCNDPDCDYRES